ncbi:MAG: PadR family transcriptional regulator [Anaerolineae bacterium]|jgi:DNA-binding PadR family transcriptional regulator
MTDPTENLISELRRGTLVLTVLSQLDEEQYGYSLAQRLADQGLEIDQGTLYPLLRRLEEQGLLDSEWSVEGPRPRRYYRLNDTGREALRTLSSEWYGLVAVLEKLLRKEERDESRVV